MKKKIMLILLVIALLVLASCNGINNQNQISVDDDNRIIKRPELSPDNPVTITVWLTTYQTVPLEDNKISALMQERLGVTLEYTVVHPYDMHRDIGPRLARNDFLDLMGTIDSSMRLTTGGALLRLDDYLDTGLWPNLLEHIAPYRGRLSYHGDEVEAGLYIIPKENRFYGKPIPTVHSGAGFWIQKSVLSYLDYPDLSNMTLERYFDMIETYMKSHPVINDMETIGFTFPTLRGQDWNMANPPMYLQGSSNTGIVIIDENFEARIYADSEYAKRYFEILNNAYHRGLLDTDIFTQSMECYIEKLSGGNVLGMYDRRWAFSTAFHALLESGQLERTWVATTPTFDGYEPRYAQRPYLSAGIGFGISGTADNPELLLTFLDTMLSEEWQIILSWGIEGEDYVIDEEGFFFRDYEQRKRQWDAYWRAGNRLEALLEMLPKREGILSCGNAFMPSEQPSVFLASRVAFELEFLQAMGKETWHDFVNEAPENPPFHPVWDISLGENPEPHMARAKLLSLTEEWMPLLVRVPQGEFEHLWEEYVKAIQEIDVQIFLDALNEGIRERMELWGE